ncbi:MAG TPA: hypothetical protein VFF65_12915 [Phycisphaerales bacterium]|nr:hypothetical protein [Phycisphaerales bacterium]
MTTTNWWTVKDAKGVKMMQVVGLHLGRRAAAKAAAEKSGAPWKALYAAGFRTVQLRISEVKHD